MNTFEIIDKTGLNNRNKSDNNDNSTSISIIREENNDELSNEQNYVFVNSNSK